MAGRAYGRPARARAHRAQFTHQNLALDRVAQSVAPPGPHLNPSPKLLRILPISHLTLARGGGSKSKTRVIGTSMTISRSPRVQRKVRKIVYKKFDIACKKSIGAVSSPSVRRIASETKVIAKMASGE